MWDIFKSIGIIDDVRGKGSLKYYKRKLNEYQENEAEISINIGLSYLDDGKFDEALKYLRKALDIYREINNKDYQAFVLDLIGDVYLSMREIDTALEEYRKAFLLYSETKSSMKRDMLEKMKEVENIKEAIMIADLNKLDKELEDDDIDYTDFEEDEPVFVEEKNECHVNYEKVVFELDKLFKIVKKRYQVKEFSKEEYEEGYVKKSLYDARKMGEDKKEIGIFLMNSYYFLKEEKVYSAMKSLKESRNISHETGDEKGEAISVLLLGIIYYLLNKEDKIYYLFKKSVDMFRSSKDKEGESIAIDLINTLYNEDVCPGDDLILTDV